MLTIVLQVDRPAGQAIGIKEAVAEEAEAAQEKRKERTI